MLISLCIIAKNEGLTIRRALESALPFVDEFVVGIDSLTTDNTLLKVQNFFSDNKVNGNLYTFDWEDDFSKARNDCIGKAKHDWIFILDGHEIVENAEKIQKVKNNGLSDFDVYVVDIKMNANGRETMFPQERLFRKEYNYFNKSHNVLVYDENKAAKINNVFINHERSEELMNKRTEQRQRMNFNDLIYRIRSGDRRAEAQIIQEYMVIKNWEMAIKSINSYLNVDMQYNEKYQVLIKLAMCYFYNKEYGESEYALRQCERFNEDKRNAHLVFLGELYFKMGYYNQAKDVLRKALTFEKPNAFWFLYPQFYYEVPNKLLEKI